MTTRRKDLTSTAGPLLFDLPLEEPLVPAEESPPEELVEPADPPTGQDEDQEALALAREPVLAGIGPRLLGGMADLLVHAGVMAAVALGLYAMAATPRLDHWPALGVLLLTFSFLYTVVSLAFWGQTAGMAWCELFSRDRLSRPLTFRQACLRWLGGLVSVLLAGLPVLLAYRGTSLADLMSASVTLQQPVVE